MAALPRPRQDVAADGRKSVPSVPNAPATLLRRIWNEYLEMPGLRLTSQQAQRLWGVDADTCTALLKTLVELRFLTRGSDGRYFRLTDGPAGGLLMARADMTDLERIR